MSYPSFDQWKASLSSDVRRLVERQVDELRQMGCPDPEITVRSEVSENFPQRATFLLLRKLWIEAIDSWRDSAACLNVARAGFDDSSPDGHFADGKAALEKMKAAGVPDEQISSFARMVAYETAFTIAYALDYGCDEGAPAHMPGWAVFETDREGNSTGRRMGGIHESILTADPSGREGRVR